MKFYKHKQSVYVSFHLSFFDPLEHCLIQVTLMLIIFEWRITYDKGIKSVPVDANRRCNYLDLHLVSTL